MSERTWVIVWGWAASGPSLWRESFTDRALCWVRVQEVMGVLDGAEPPGSGSSPRVPTLQVWAGSDVTTFRRYEAGSRFCRWGRWGSFTMRPEGGRGASGAGGVGI